MRIIGSISKSGKKNISILHLLDNSKWKNIQIENEISSLNIWYYLDDNIRIINNRNNVFISDDNLIFLDSGSQKRLDNDKIAEMLEEKNIDLIKNIQSDFNLILYDKIKARIYLASNRAAAGRMFYVFWKNSLFFSNDFSLLLRLKRLTLNDIALYAYTEFGAIPEDITLDVFIKAVPVGHYAEIDYKNGSSAYTPFFKFNYNNSNTKEIDKKLLLRTEQSLKNNAKVLSNDKIHMLISGGIDSSLFAFYLKEFASNIIGHYCRFGVNDPEQEYAEKVAKELKIPLKVHTLYSENIIPEIEDTASNTSYPHCDYSNISENFLIRKIKEEFGSGSLIIDCNGGDDGFGYQGLLKIPIWKKLYKIPTILLKILGDISTIGETWMYESKIKRKLFYFYRAREKNLYISYMISGAGSKLFIRSNQYDKKINELVNLFFNNNIQSNYPTEYEKMNVAQFFHWNSRLWTAKGYSPAERWGVRIVYPYIWKNILELQCEIPLNMKIFKNEIKFSLKKLLEAYMPKDFIYRKKSGFQPPLYQWLRIDNNYDYAYNTIMNGIAIKKFKKDKVNKIFELIKANEKVSSYAINFIWSLLFFEVWLKSNNIHLTDKSLEKVSSFQI